MKIKEQDFLNYLKWKTNISSKATFAEIQAKFGTEDIEVDDNGQIIYPTDNMLIDSENINK